MALEAVVFPHHLFFHPNRESTAGCPWDPPSTNQIGAGFECPADSSDQYWGVGEACPDDDNGSGRRKRRRGAKASRNKEEVEYQRMTHIAVERNRRKQMNEYLAVLRSLMPPSYVQRGDQASIIGGAINFVRELEQLLQTLEAQRRVAVGGDASCPLSHFFTFPQFSTSSSDRSSCRTSGVADVEVTMVESHANLKVVSRRRPRQLLRMVVGLQTLRLTTLHLNVTTIQQMVLFSFSLKVEEECLLSSADEIAGAVYQMLVEMQEAQQLIM